MAGAHTMKRLFNLYLIFLKTDDVKDKITLKYEIDLMQIKLTKDDTVPADIKRSFNEILKQYTIIYETDELIQKTEAEERVQELLEEMKSYIGYKA